MNKLFLIGLIALLPFSAWAAGHGKEHGGKAAATEHGGKAAAEAKEHGGKAAAKASEHGGQPAASH